MATESFLNRWSKRKQETQSENTDELTEENLAPETPEMEGDEPSLQDDSLEDEAPSMEDVEQLKAGDSASVFLAKGVASEVKKAALRKLFHSEAYNVLDGMNEYDLDYSNTPNLAADVAASLRKWTKEKLEEATQDEQENLPETSTDKTVNEESLNSLKESETKSTHEELGDNLSYPPGQNVPNESVDKNSDGS
ncbi:DUF3306 domain-containing protein [Grimontia marina]|uniref:DUF3306 domain-containing protein n=1 Tax=Grimontia marina TaxID=646534 RepID=A0A128EUG0_9GAMM|nr:DUF3306 domain-containing protein [Grimontia marina]CZF77651.1 hypothetical protein GMA8713_00264 [Grimontia marina]